MQYMLAIPTRIIPGYAREGIAIAFAKKDYHIEHFRQTVSLSLFAIIQECRSTGKPCNQYDSKKKCPQ